MTNSASDQHDDMVLEPVPTDLLPIHQRLEDDGGSWRASLPPLDQLLRRVKARPPRDMRHDARVDDSGPQPLSLADASLSSHSRTPQLHTRSRRKDSSR
jgi:hypothetical protein